MEEDIPVIGLNFRTRKPRPYNNNHSLGWMIYQFKCWTTLFSVVQQEIDDGTTEWEVFAIVVPSKVQGGKCKDPYFGVGQGSPQGD